MVNLRREMRNILREFGDKAILLSAKDGSFCTCVDRLTRNGRADCPYCLGSGFFMKAKAVYCRSQQSATSDALPKSLVQSAVGPLAVGQRMWFLEYQEDAERFDYLIFCTWDGDQPVLDKGATVYKILNTEPMIGDYGRVEFLEIISQSDPINAQVKLVQLGKYFDYHLSIKEYNN